MMRLLSRKCVRCSTFRLEQEATLKREHPTLFIAFRAAQRAMNGFSRFREEVSLGIVRELMLREIASHIDLRRRESDEAAIAAAPDQVMVSLSSRGPDSKMLLRYASRLAGRLKRNWYALYVQTRREEPTVIDAETQRLLSETLTLANQLGAEVFTRKGDDVASAILQFAKEYRVGHLVIGRPGRMPTWQRWLGRRNLVEQLLEQAKGVTVVILDTHKHEAPPRRISTDVS